MAGRTSAGAQEERFARVCVAREELIGGALQTPVCRPDIGRQDPRFHECDDITHLIRAERNRRHSSIGSPVPDYRSDEVAILIVPDHDAANQTRTVRSSVRIHTVAECTRLRELALPAPDRGIRRRLPQVRRQSLRPQTPDAQQDKLDLD